MSDQPTEKPTVEIEKPPAWAISMREQMVQGFHAVRADVALVTDEVKLVKERMTIVEGRTAALETRADANSMRARGQSELELQGQAQLSQERSAREELAKKVETLSQSHDEHATAITKKVDEVLESNAAQTKLIQKIVDGASQFMQRPATKYVAAALWTAFVAWAARKGISLQ